MTCLRSCSLALLVAVGVTLPTGCSGDSSGGAGTASPAAGSAGAATAASPTAAATSSGFAASPGSGRSHVGAAVVLPPGKGPHEPTGAGLLDVSGMLRTEDLTPWDADASGWARNRIAGIPRSTTYDSVHVHAAGEGAHHGAAIQVWLHADAAAARRAWERDLSRYPSAVATPGVGDASFRAYRSGILYLHYLSEEHKAVVSVTCALMLCSSMPIGGKPGVETLRWDRATTLALATLERLPSVAGVE